MIILHLKWGRLSAGKGGKKEIKSLSTFVTLTSENLELSKYLKNTKAGDPISNPGPGGIFLN